MVAMQFEGACADDADAKRIEARRAREKERLKRLMPGRLRSIGADIAGLKNQLDEKQMYEEAIRESERRMDDENDAVRQYLVKIDMEDAIAKRRERITLFNDWDMQIAKREQERKVESAQKSLPTHPESCGLSAAQKFDGEDELKAERLRLQALQAKDYFSQQLIEKRARTEEDLQKEAFYDNFVMEIEKLQEEMHRSNEKERGRLALELQNYNASLAQQRKDMEVYLKNLDLAKELEEINFHLNCKVSDTDFSKRGDSWKGLSASQTRQLLSENEHLLREKCKEKELRQHEREMDNRQQLEWQRQLIREEHETQLRKAQIQLEVNETLKKQAADALLRESSQANQSRGQFDPSFFQSFGRSYR